MAVLLWSLDIEGLLKKNVYFLVNYFIGYMTMMSMDHVLSSSSSSSFVIVCPVNLMYVCAMHFVFLFLSLFFLLHHRRNSMYFFLLKLSSN
jgi:hypothetical protein